MKLTIYKILNRFPLFDKIRGVGLILGRNSYMRKTGWFASIKKRMPVNADGEPIPWYTYPSIHFLESKDLSNLKVFEFGSGNSTKWWSSNADSVISCEHDKIWFDLVKDDLPENVNYKYVELETNGDYCRAAKDNNCLFDVIVIDGRDRVNCSKNCIEFLSDGGVVIWDNSERTRYQEGYDYLKNNGFRRLDFYGLGPIVNYSWMTSVFYKNNNCLGI